MQKLTRLPDQRGSALVFALVFGIVLSIMAIATLRLIEGGSDMSRRDIAVIKSYWANEGAQRVAWRYLSCVNTLPNADINPFTTTPAVVLNGDTPSVSLIAIANSSGTYIISYSCTTKTVMPGVGLRNTTTCFAASINSMSRYTWFEKQTSSAVWAAMIVYGDFHSNGYINAGDYMTNEIHVTGKATTAGRINASQQYDRPNFPGAYRNGFSIVNSSGNNVSSEPASWFASRIPNYGTTGTIQTSTISDTSSTFSTAYTIPVTSQMDSIGIQLNGSSVKIWKRQSSTWSLLTTQNVSSIQGGIIKSAKPTYVWGTLDGKLTIVSLPPSSGSTPSDIIIGDNVQYANTDLTSSDDVLALVSTDDVVIPNKTNNSTIGMVHNFTQSGTNVYASLFMSDGKIDVQNLSGYSVMRDLTIKGGLLINSSAGTYSTQGTDHGIRALYYQDPRFVGNAAMPPGIPFAKATDPERSIGATTALMFVLGNGTWKNTVGVAL